jgi:hypothetical protein
MREIYQKDFKLMLKINYTRSQHVQVRLFAILLEDRRGYSCYDAYLKLGTA